MVRTAESLNASLDELARAREGLRQGARSAWPARAAGQRAGRRRPCCAPSSASRSASPPRGRCGTSSTAKFGQPVDLEALLAASDEELREAGLSRQKAGYPRSLAGLVLSGELDLAHLPDDDEEAIALLTKIKGIGRWSAEIYLLFAEGRTDVWPAGDLAVQIEIGKLLGLDGKPTEKQLRELAEAWRPHRGAAAVLAWHSYNAPPLD